MISHNFINTEKLRSWHIALLRYSLVAYGQQACVFHNTCVPMAKTVHCSQRKRQNHKSSSLTSPWHKTAPIKSKSFSLYINHPMLEKSQFNKIILHASSSKLAANLHPAIYASYGLVFACISGQMPKVVKAKQSVASFKLVKGSVIGLQTIIRGRQMDQFRYKWSFLAASADGAANVSKNNKGYGLKNIFIFPELDLLDYYAFSPLSGFDLIFDSRLNQSK